MVEMIQKYLKDEIELEYGKGLTRNQRRDGKIPVYGSNGIVDYNDKFYFEGPGIIIGRKGTVGSLKYEENNFWAIDTTYVVKLKNKNEDLIFWYYFLQTLGLERMNSHSAVPGLNRDRVYNIKINIPKKQEDRKRISIILGDLDKKIELNNQINDNLFEIIKQYIKEKYYTNNEIKNFQMSNLGKIQGGYAFKSKELLNETTNNKVFKIKNIGSSCVDIENTQYIENEVANKVDKKFLVTRGDVIIAMTGAELGKTGYLYGTENRYFLNQRVGVVRGNDKKSNLYLCCVFLLDEIQSLMHSKGYGSAQPNISTNDIEKIRIPILNEKQLDEFYEIADPIYKKMILNMEENQKLTQIRDVLLPKIMNGKIDLNKIEI